MLKFSLISVVTLLVLSYQTAIAETKKISFETIKIMARHECRKVHFGGCTAYPRKSYNAPEGKLIVIPSSHAYIAKQKCPKKSSYQLLWDDEILVHTPIGVIPHSTGVSLLGGCESGSGPLGINDTFHMELVAKLTVVKEGLGERLISKKRSKLSK